MKNISRLFLIALTFIFLLVSCAQDVIFYAIDQEIKLKDPTIYNVVHSMVEFDINNDGVKELLATNGKINVKPSVAAQVGWSDYDTPGFVVSLAVGGANLYALTFDGSEFEEDEKTFYVYHRTASTGWALVPKYEDSIDMDNSFVAPVLFDDGAGNAFLRKLDGKIYSLIGDNHSSEYGDSTSTASTSTVTAARLGGTTYFSNATGFVADGSNLYQVSGGSVRYSTDGTAWDGDVSVSSDGNYTDAAAVFRKSATEKYLLVGTTSGARAIRINTTAGPEEGTLEGGAEELTDVGLGVNSVGALNSADTFSGGLYTFDEDGDGFDDVIYSVSASSSLPDRNGLWSYYPSTGEWNRE